MTDELTTQAERAVATLDALVERAERAVADLELFATWTRSPYVEAVLARAARSAVMESQSPWVDRAGAAARWRCSVDEIDRAARAGALVRLERGETPLFEKAQGDEAIRTNNWKYGKQKPAST